ncbi:hypothetical protein Kyoto22A_04290 [Helicobacter pylori]
MDFFIPVLKGFKEVIQKGSVKVGVFKRRLNQRFMPFFRANDAEEFPGFIALKMQHARFFNARE